MERILDAHKREPNPDQPSIRVDESPRRLIGEIRTPIPAAPGFTAGRDTEYARKGAARLFMFTAPRVGSRRVEVTERRTAIDWAHQVKKLVDVDFPEAKSIALVPPQPRHPRRLILHKAFEPKEAGRTARKPESVYAPEHGSQLNVAEIVFSVLNRTGFPERVPTIGRLRRGVAAWQERGDRSRKGVVWRFATEDARVEPAGLYPKLAA